MRIIEKTLGWIYHPILHSIRNSTFFNQKQINKLIKNCIKSEERKKRIYIDISDIFESDIMTGIQRVSHNISNELQKLNDEFDIITVFCKNFYGFFDCNTKEKVTYKSGDIFFGLDKSFHYSYKYNKFYKNLIKNNIKVVFFIHDLIPIRFPQYFSERVSRFFKIFFNQVVNYNQLICNSKSTADDLKLWLSENPKIKHNKNLKISYSLLGCDLKKEEITYIKRSDYDSPISFLMVSTVEPRKKYDQVIKAFNILWEKNIQVKLTIVGRKGWKCKGWKCDETFNLIEEIKEFNKKLFWLNTGISDEELIKNYRDCDAVIMASIAEGFGLAVAEASYFKKPLIIRDIPPFREIAGENAYYFDSLSPEILAEKIETWISLFKQNKEPDSSLIKTRTWSDCASDIYKSLIEE